MASDRAQDRHPPLALVAALLLGPPTVLLLAAALRWLPPGAVGAALAGCATSTAGGMLAGVAAERLLRRGEGSTQHLAGLAVTSALGVLTIGYVYLAHLDGPMIAVGTPERIVSQSVTFVAFLTSQAAGILLAMRYARRHRIHPLASK